MNAYKDAWKDWIGQEASDKMAEYGYFVMDLNGTDGKPILPGAKLISLNTQAENTDNWWLAGEREDPGSQIEWLEDTLSTIEEEGGIAYIIGHIKP
jgi:hypothetical protein